MKRKVGVVLMSVCSLFLLSVSATSTERESFQDNEDYYYELCMNEDMSEADEQLCEYFYDYLNKKGEDAAKELEEINKDINEIKKDIQKVLNTVNTLSGQIRLKEAQIYKAQKNIEALEVQITAKEAEIVAREADIEVRDNKIKARMESMQSIMATNAFADFIMGAKDFVDMIRRVEGVNDITAYDKEQIRELQVQRDLLIEDKRVLNVQREDLSKNKTNLEKQRVALQGTKATQENLVKVYREKEAELFAQQQKAAQNLDEVQKALADLSTIKNFKSSNGFIKPVSTFKVSAGTWYYPASFCASGANKCTHLGTDFAAAVGTNVVAPARSVVLYMHDKCPTYGGLGNWCGSPGSAGAGNHILLATQVNGKTYAIKIGHMQSGVSKYIQWPAAGGKALIVEQGQVIGKVGTSGNSSGPHAHIEVMYFGTKSLESVVIQFRNQGKFDFGLGWGNAGLTTTCNKKGYVAPCRYKPEEIFNVTVGKSY